MAFNALVAVANGLPSNLLMDRRIFNYLTCRLLKLASRLTKRGKVSASGRNLSHDHEVLRSRESRLPPCLAFDSSSILDNDWGRWNDFGHWLFKGEVETMGRMEMKITTIGANRGNICS